MKLTDLQKQWIAALRGGKYRQARGYLCLLGASQEEESYCCLGVACELMKLSRIPVDTADGKAYSYIFSKRPYVSDATELESTLCNELRLYGATGSIRPEYHTEAIGVLGFDADAFNLDGALSLAWLNDHNYSFNQIADLLETYPHWFFYNEQ